MLPRPAMISLILCADNMHLLDAFWCYGCDMIHLLHLIINAFLFWVLRLHITWYLYIAQAASLGWLPDRFSQPKKSASPAGSPAYLRVPQLLKWRGRLICVTFVCHILSLSGDRRCMTLVSHTRLLTEIWWVRIDALMGEPTSRLSRPTSAPKKLKKLMKVMKAQRWSKLTVRSVSLFNLLSLLNVVTPLCLDAERACHSPTALGCTLGPNGCTWLVFTGHVNLKIENMWQSSMKNGKVALDYARFIQNGHCPLCMHTGWQMKVCTVRLSFKCWGRCFLFGQCESQRC